MNISTLTKRSRENKSNKAYHVDSSTDIRFTLKYRPNSQGYGVFGESNVKDSYYVFLDGNLIGGLFNLKDDDTYTMYIDSKPVDNKPETVDGLTKVIHIERAFMDGNLISNDNKSR